MNCPNCGNNLLPGARFCTKCGSPIEAQANTQNNEMQTTLYANVPVDHGINVTEDSAQESLAQSGSKKEKKSFEGNDKYAYIAIAGATVLAALIGLIVKMSKLSGYDVNPSVKYEDETASADYEIEDNWEEETVAEDAEDEKAADINVEELVLEIRENYNTTVERMNSGFYDSKKMDNGISVYRDGGEVKAIVVTEKDSGSGYSQSYYYDDNGEIYFASYKDEDINRFYCNDGSLIRKYYRLIWADARK